VGIGAALSAWNDSNSIRASSRHQES